MTSVRATDVSKSCERAILSSDRDGLFGPKTPCERQEFIMKRMQQTLEAQLAGVFMLHTMCHVQFKCLAITTK